MIMKRCYKMVTTLKKGYKFCGFNNCGKIVKEPKCYCYIHEPQAVNVIALEVKRLTSINQSPLVPYLRTIEELEESEVNNYD